ncbi:MAG: Pr6Pr family membrane protein [Treponema sp.]|nr:Pr6Pr family membrane protein [Treponema sp.]
MEIKNKLLTINSQKIIRVTINAALIICAGIGIINNAQKSNIASTIAYFTIQSNLLCVILAGITLAREIKQGNSKEKIYIFFKGMALVSILLTFFIYNFVLKPTMDMADSTRKESLDSILLHVAVPLLMFGDFLFFEKKNLYKWWYPFTWALFPIFYVAYTAVYKALGGLYRYNKGAAKFPYFFLDYETYGFGMVGLWILIITIGFIGFSFLLLGLCKILTRLKAGAAGHPSGETDSGSV